MRVMRKYWADWPGYFVSFWLPDKELGDPSEEDREEWESVGDIVSIYGRPRWYDGLYSELLGQASTDLDGYPTLEVESGEGRAYEFVFATKEGRQEFMKYVRDTGFRPSQISYAEGIAPLGGPR